MSTIKILLVEDEKTLVQIVSETLRSKGFAVETAYDGIEGLKRFFEVHPDVLIADVMMPRLDGFEMVRRIRKTDDRTPVLFLTAKSTPDDVVTGFELGANDYLKKPFAIQELIVRIKALMGKAYMTERQETEQSEYQIGDYRFFPVTQTLEYIPDGKTISLSHRQTEILRQLCRAEGKSSSCRTYSWTSGATMISSTPAVFRYSSHASDAASPKTHASASSMSAAPATS